MPKTKQVGRDAGTGDGEAQPENHRDRNRTCQEAARSAA